MLGKTHRVVDPAHAMANVVLVLSPEDKLTFWIELLSKSIELAIYISPMQCSPILISINALALQSIIHIETLQRTMREKNR